MIQKDYKAIVELIKNVHTSYMEKHYKDIETKESECGLRGELTTNLEEVTCLKCLESIKQEWERQVKYFKGQPKKNAKYGLKETIKRIKEVSSHSSPK